jgi:hypothetical protein
MESAIEFLEYVWDKKEDHRISIEKRVKFGYKFFTIEIQLPTSSQNSFIINVDARNFTFEFIYGYRNTLVLQSEELTKVWLEKLDNYYESNFSKNSQKIISDFIQETDPSGKDFWREYRMSKIFKIKE